MHFLSSAPGATSCEAKLGWPTTVRGGLGPARPLDVLTTPNTFLRALAGT